MAKMLYSQVINVTSFAWLHLGEQDVVELRDGHWSNFGLFLSKLEDVEVIKLAEIIKNHGQNIWSSHSICQDVQRPQQSPPEHLHHERTRQVCGV